VMVVTARPFATREEIPVLLETRKPDPLPSEDIDLSLDGVSMPQRDGLNKSAYSRSNEVRSLDSKFSSGSRSLRR